ncbi:tRNA pseudouridine(38-40) synthase [Candidatus Phytoplasma oryzae]|uniref:tRNA pseudouridine synthase A n=1 Tax=Candidatus Phytoplasma oryzae TaxID=203274 RepID=A0A139JQ90_9MOLU|nr:tRNA pseudouridine(38-40) synthase TruA [Candidatus Phytoplasma oryzae]KXT29137.1 tRNA pseudouridine(38-40) synthase [Candidatus Phytoplasma oryzae]RAM57757.1 pseudouridine synthase [Candidatus Phytoplasma oryzae]
MTTYKLILSYDGTDYYGYQKQPFLKTIQSMLEKSLFKITKKKINTFASSRTDKGVHALGQVVHFKTNFFIFPNIFKKILNIALPKDIRVIDIEKVHNSFHARYSAKSKIYKYVFSKTSLNSFNCRFQVYFKNLNFILINQALTLLEGEQNFFLFTSNKNKNKSSIRHIFKVFSKETELKYCLFFHGKSFLKQMILFLVGFLIKIGQKQKSFLDLQNMFNLKTKKKLPFVAPPCGLYLKKVFY